MDRAGWAGAFVFKHAVSFFDEGDNQFGNLLAVYGSGKLVSNVNPDLLVFEVVDVVEGN